MESMGTSGDKPVISGTAGRDAKRTAGMRNLTVTGLVVCCIIWGFSYIGTQQCYRWFSPMDLVKYRLLAASITLGITSLIMRRNFRVAWRDVPYIALGGFMGMFMHYALTNLSLSRISASASSVIGGLIPVMTLLGEIIVTAIAVKASGSKMGFSRIGSKATVAALISTVGIALVVGLSNEAKTEEYFLGALYMFLAVAVWVVYGIVSAVSVTKYDSIVVTFYQTVAAVAFSFLLLPGEPVAWGEITWDGWLYLFILGGLGSGLCYVVYNVSTTYISVTSANIMMNITPLAAIITDMIVFGQMLTLAAWAGTALILLAAVLAVTPLPLKKRKRHDGG